MARFSSARLWESPLAESRQYPAFDHENGGFYFSFIARFSDARWNNHCAIVVRQIAIGGVQVRLIVAGIFDAGFFVGHNDGGHSPEELQGTWDPIQLARSPTPGRLGVGVVAGAQNGHEDHRLLGLSRVGINDRNGLTGMIDK
jgi:hypothetical protein